MSKFLCFCLGVICGMITFPLIVGNVSDYDNPYGIKGLRMLEKKGSCITNKNLEIFQNHAEGIALAHPINDFETLVLLIDESGRLFYDGEMVKNPSKKCAKQIGVYQYETNAGPIKTVPAVIIE